MEINTPWKWFIGIVISILCVVMISRCMDKPDLKIHHEIRNENKSQNK